MHKIEFQYMYLKLAFFMSGQQDVPCSVCRGVADPVSPFLKKGLNEQRIHLASRNLGPKLEQGYFQYRETAQKDGQGKEVAGCVFGAEQSGAPGVQ
jgi:hypothetical protein